MNTAIWLALGVLEFDLLVLLVLLLATWRKPIPALTDEDRLDWLENQRRRG